jgi:TPR repeat protein
MPRLNLRNKLLLFSILIAIIPLVIAGQSLIRIGKVEAQLLFGEYYHARHEYAEAVPWLRLAAEQGAVEAQRRLALMYEAGQGVPREDEQAAFWLHCATAQGDPLAFYKEGFSYATNAGLP